MSPGELPAPNQAGRSKGLKPHPPPGPQHTHRHTLPSLLPLCGGRRLSAQHPEALSAAGRGRGWQGLPGPACLPVTYALFRLAAKAKPFEEALSKQTTEAISNSFSHSAVPFLTAPGTLPPAQLPPSPAHLLPSLLLGRKRPGPAMCSLVAHHRHCLIPAPPELREHSSFKLLCCLRPSYGGTEPMQPGFLSVSPSLSSPILTIQVPE